ncbi:MAG TPA: protein kinase [Pyrinomonadaceae bacterium]|jgi:serine/threonine-protein kinase|nr:protein kinase [Pyrinomonadaceae bacterium]
MKACPNCGKEYPDTITLCPADGVALEKTDDSLIGQVLAGKYRIEERLSSGGMGTVYRGTHVLMDKTVAVKVLRPSLAADEKIVARFSREARAASKISHPHALSVTDFGEAENGIVFLVMEYLSGRTLKEVIRDDGPMQLPRAVEILRQVGGALDAAHGEGVVHRDLKSDNIMLLSSSGTDYAKVLDFGIAKIKEPEGAYDPGLTAPEMVIGTPQYMSPEQCSQSPDIDARSDIYSLGVILYEMLVGHVPFTGASPTAIMLKHLQEPAPTVLAERRDVPEAIGRVVARALEKRPEDRYETVAELVEDFTIAAGMEPAVATSEPSKRVETLTPEQPGEDDEATLVRRRVTRPMTPPAIPEATTDTPARQRVVTPLPSQPPPASSFNPWKVLVPSMIGLLVIFGVIYAFTRNSQPTNATTPGPALAADPNSSPVEPAKPPTGASEAGIPAGGNTSQPANSNANTSPSPEASESPNDLANENLNANENTNQNSNSSKSPTPALPSPTRTIDVGVPPPPSPKPTNPPLPKPTAAGPTASPAGR